MELKKSNHYLNLEIETLNLLEWYLKTSNMDYKLDYNFISHDYGYDAIVEGELFGLEGRIAIVVDNPSHNRKKIFMTLNHLNTLSKDEKNIDGILIVTEMNSVDFDDYQSEIPYKLINRDDLKFVDKLDVDDEILFTSKYKNYISSIFEYSLNMNSEEFYKQKKSLIANLKDSYKNNDLVLFMGAGLSMDAGILKWNDLLSELWTKMISKKMQEHNVSLNQYEEKRLKSYFDNFEKWSALLQARYLRIGLEDEFVNTLGEVLYKNIESDEFGISKLLTSVSKLCMPPRNGYGVRGVVTYNFDDLIEYNLEKQGIKFKSIYRETDFPDINELGVYHVHGYLPRNFENHEIESDQLITFSEEAYHSLFMDPYSWSNITQLNFLRENTCLLIGLSLQDPNIRRLLDIAFRKNHSIRHYAILKKDIIDIRNTKRIRGEVLSQYANVDQLLLEKSYNELGLNVIWVDSYDEIPQIIDSLLD